MDAVGSQAIVRRSFSDTWRTIYEHLWADALMAATGALLGALLLFANGEPRLLTYLGAAVAATAPLVILIVAVFIYQASKARTRIMSDYQGGQLSELIDSSKIRFMLTHITSLISRDDIRAFQAFAFGSCLIVYPPPHDVDIAIHFLRSSAREINRANSAINAMAREFFDQFGHPMHVQLFLYHEIDRLNSFLSEADPVQQIYSVESEARR